MAVDPPPPFCPSNLDHDFADPSVALRSGLHPSAVSFLDRLNLPAVHPLCVGNATAAFDNAGDLPPTTFDTSNEELGLEGILAACITLYSQVAPALLAMAELWLRLFAFVIAPVSVVYLIFDEIMHLVSDTESSSGSRMGKWRHRFATASSVLGMASAAVLLTDSLYVHEYGRTFGIGLFVVLSILSTRAKKRRKLGGLVLFAILLIKITVVICLVRSEGGTSLLDHPGLDLPTATAGLYYNEENKFISTIVKHWPETYRTYSQSTGATAWLPTGDSKTGIPFLVNSSPKVEYRRVWASNEEDGEHVALDIAFPADGVHRSEKPVYMIFHGLNGGSSEEYVREFVFRRIAEGSTCVVMVARGLMDTPVVGWNVFHGARVSDAHVASGYVKNALQGDQMLAGVGYSMGAIVLANYVARSGKDCHLDAAMAVSGGLDMREQINFYRSQRLWQPMLAKELRDTFIIGKFEARYRHRLSDDDFLELMRSAHISEIDRHGVVTYNKFDDLMHYYSEMSAFGDHAICIDRSGGESADDKTCPANDIDADSQVGRLSNVAIPMCALHALDDPLVTWRSVANVDPQLVVKKSDNLLLLLTKSGGHVGWPLGMNPAERGWEWMNNSVRDFVLAVDAARKEQNNRKQN